MVRGTEVTVTSIPDKAYEITAVQLSEKIMGNLSQFV